MTPQEALRTDTCTFPSKTIALHRTAVLTVLIRWNPEHWKSEDMAAEYEAELARVWLINEKLLRIVPNDPEAVELCQDVFHSTEGQ